MLLDARTFWGFLFFNVSASKCQAAERFIPGRHVALLAHSWGSLLCLKSVSYKVSSWCRTRRSVRLVAGQGIGNPKRARSPMLNSVKVWDKIPDIYIYMSIWYIYIYILIYIYIHIYIYFFFDIYILISQYIYINKHNICKLIFKFTSCCYMYPDAIGCPEDLWGLRRRAAEDAKSRITATRSARPKRACRGCRGSKVRPSKVRVVRGVFSGFCVFCVFSVGIRVI